MSTTSPSINAALAELNEQQRQGACHGDSPLLIVAGAGTGKTTTLAHRVAYLIASGVDPGRILLLTFTRRAATEMLRRVHAILSQCRSSDRTGSATTRKIWGGTFHAMAARLLRQHGKLIGLEPEFSILDRSDAEDLLDVLRSELQLAKTQKRFPLKGTCVSIYSRCMNSQQPLDKILQMAFPWCSEYVDSLKKLFEEYVDRKEQRLCLDYDDLLLFWKALAADASARAVLQERFDCVLVDEYQDTNVLQSEILGNLCPDGKGLTVVGDDAQSIYSFRAATVRNILDFPRQYPGTTIVALEENYRSTQPILDATNRVIALARERHTKNLWSKREVGRRPLIVSCLDEDDQSQFIIEQILAHREKGTSLQQQAILFRASHHSLALEVELARHNIPFHKYGGLKFTEAAHIKDLISFMRLAENPRDPVSTTRVLMLLPGIGRKRAGHLSDLLMRAGWKFDAWNDFSPPAASLECWREFVSLMSTLASHGPRQRELAAEIHLVCKFYVPLLEQKYSHPQPRIRDLQQLELMASRFTSRASFLSEITLDPPSSTQDLAGDPWLDEDYLILSTIHSAKGLEWDTVFLIHAADGNIPSDMATRNDEEVEEERRLVYVALTRAKNHLFVCHPQRYYFQGRRRSDAHSFSQLTRFIPAELFSWFDRCSTEREMSESLSDTDDQSSGLTTQDIRSQIKDIWS